jgi:hypothetical protein
MAGSLIVHPRGRTLHCQYPQPQTRWADARACDWFFAWCEDR